ncbi:hypothetical protein [Aureibacter tunicatorum]|uniref:1-phosphatidylinositol phosphodiesterase n=1 Tax=Aureibacter tunicatorum TaxID=866807 RepID=A0AAE4BRI9_9BACT|nr:hypothetical protein [Aureibacter tunicatorum]MDR6240264.1 hypothetical protein [Aureibacter tunicatorum]BDD05855.1 hypothetical protein AUTU_33380 [Aureibacter tunicatorum]
MKKLLFHSLAASMLFASVSCQQEMEQEVSNARNSNTYSNNGIQMMTVPFAPELKIHQLGLSTELDGYSQRTDIAMNTQNNIVEAHQSRGGSTIWYHVGKLDQNEINWSESNKYDNGKKPSIDMTNDGKIISVHETSNIFTSDLWYKIGTLNGNRIDWKSGKKYDKGSTPSITINDNGRIVEVHKSQSNYGLFYKTGTLNASGSVSWSSTKKYDSGKEPSVAINNSGQIVEVHQSETTGNLYYHVGSMQNGEIIWGPSIFYQSGAQPSVALLDDGTVFETHTSEGLKNDLWQMKGKIANGKIEWEGSSEYFDTGNNSSVDANETYIAQTHESESSTGGIWSSSALYTDHENWMRDLHSVIANKTLGEIVLPGSHDAGMYPSSLGQTQDQNLYEQLKGGVRYFDLRPDEDMNIFHGPVTGPKVDEVLSDVRRYMDEGRKELVILKFSHFKNFNAQVYSTLINKIKSHLSPYLFDNAYSKRVGELSLDELIQEQGTVLIVNDESYPVEFPSEGIHTYRDWDSSDAINGDLIVYDKYSNTTDYNSMKNDQISKFHQFNGMSQNGQIACDMFLMSWTLTPITDVFSYSRPANANLGKEMKKLEANAQGYIPNILYVDYYQLSRATATSILMNRKLN